MLTIIENGKRRRISVAELIRCYTLLLQERK